MDSDIRKSTQFLPPASQLESSEDVFDVGQLGDSNLLYDHKVEEIIEEDENFLNSSSSGSKPADGLHGEVRYRRGSSSIQISWRLERLKLEIIYANSKPPMQELKEKFRQDRRLAFDEIKEYM